MVIGSRPTLVPSEAVQLPTTEGQEQVCGFHSFFETASDMLANHPRDGKGTG
jgi:hypothetical protein